VEAPAAPPERSPLLVFGVAHSGTTILYRMLAYHPDLTWFSQFSLRGGEVPGRRRAPGANRLDVALRSIPHQWRKGKTRIARLLVPRPGEARTIWDSLLGEETPAAGRVRSTMTAFSRRHGRRTVLAKWPEFHQHLDVLDETFPQARFVHIVRDGRPIALSLRPKFERTLGHDEALQAAARHWVDVLTRTDAAGEIDLLEVRYEDFCGDVHGTIRVVLDHAGLDADAFPFHQCPRVLSNRNGWHLAAATTDELDEVSHIQQDVLRRHGYPSVPAADQGSR
jgi:Sulfotransferase family